MQNGSYIQGYNCHEYLKVYLLPCISCFRTFILCQMHKLFRPDPTVNRFEAVIRGLPDSPAAEDTWYQR